MLYQNSQATVFSFPRKMFARSYIISDALDLFGQQGGFENLLNILLAGKNGQKTITVPHIFSICSFLARSQPLWHKQFACNYIQRFSKVLLESLCYINMEVNDTNKGQLIVGPL